jgi:hypothetical protein
MLDESVAWYDPHQVVVTFAIGLLRLQGEGEPLPHSMSLDLPFDGRQHLGAALDEGEGFSMVTAVFSMLAFGSANTRQPVALLLRSPLREEIMQIVIVAAFGIPGILEVFDHVAHLSLDPMLFVVIADETDYIPMLLGERQPLLCGQGLDSVSVNPSFAARASTKPTDHSSISWI